MSIIEIGATASACLACLALVSKLVGLIRAIQSLVDRLDRMQAQIERNQEVNQALIHRVDHLEDQVVHLDRKLGWSCHHLELLKDQWQVHSHTIKEGDGHVSHEE